MAETPDIDVAKRLENLRMIMAKRRMNPTQVARLAELGTNTVRGIVNGATQPRHDTLERICNVLGVSNVAILDSDNPLSEVRNELYKLLSEMDETQTSALLDEARAVSGSLVE